MDPNTLNSQTCTACIAAKYCSAPFTFEGISEKIILVISYGFVLAVIGFGIYLIYYINTSNSSESFYSGDGGGAAATSDQDGVEDRVVQFKRATEQSMYPKLIMFRGETCPPCRRIFPEFRKIQLQAQASGDKLFGKPIYVSNIEIFHPEHQDEAQLFGDYASSLGQRQPGVPMIILAKSTDKSKSYVLSAPSSNEEIMRFIKKHL